MDDPHFSDLIHARLLPGERIQWAGHPRSGLVLSGRDALLIPFSFLWGGFAVFWNVSVWSFSETNGAPDLFFRLWGLPFLVVGIYIMVGRFFHDAVNRKRMVYAVTDQRILMLGGWPRASFKSLDLARLPKLELSEYADGTGTIELESANSIFGGGRTGLGYWVPSLSSNAQLFRIDHPRQVYEIIRKHSGR